MKYDRMFLCLLFAFLLLTIPGYSAERLPFGGNWKFKRHDDGEEHWRLPWRVVEPWALRVTANPLIVTGEKAGRPDFPAPELSLSKTMIDYDDSAWQSVELPHDNAIGEPFALENEPRTARLPCSDVGWYRKTFALPKAAADSKFFLDFDGVMSHSAVWVNGRFAGGWGYGYTSFRIDITSLVKRDQGAQNVVTVRTARPLDSSRWYSGAGMIRNVWLVVARPVRIAQWGVFVTTPVVEAERAVIDIRVKVQNDTKSAVKADIEAAVYRRARDGRPEGEPVATARKAGIVAAPSSDPVVSEITVKLDKPRLWSPENPAMYVVKTTLRTDGGLPDIEETPFGIRKLEYDARNGLKVNGKAYRIQGMCVHTEFGAFGAAVNVPAMERYFRQLREAGCNAIRLTHNPAAPEEMDLLDRMGFLVMAEFTDQWRALHSYNRVVPYSPLFDAWHEPDLRAFVRRDRNHPCVVMWSIGNELGEVTSPEKYVPIAKELREIVRQEDTTRPVMSANNNANAGFNAIGDVLDIFGYNYYGRGVYERFHREKPNTFVFGSETVAMGSSRGVFVFPLDGPGWEQMENGRLSSYCATVAGFDPKKPLKGGFCIPDAEMMALDMYPFVGGHFVWTGVDYLGAPGSVDLFKTHGRVTDPALVEKNKADTLKYGSPIVLFRSCNSGLLDTAAFKKEVFWLYKSYWCPNEPVAFLLPHWNWPDRVGKVTPVHLFSNGDEAELFLNGKSLGVKKRGKYEYRFRWDEVRYEPGTVKAVVRKDGKPWAAAEIRTTGKPESLRLAGDRESIAADGDNLVFFTVEALDKAGNAVPDVDLPVKIGTTPADAFLLADNGNENDWTPFGSRTRKMARGKLLVVVKAPKKWTGTITVHADAPGLAPATATVKVVTGQK